MSQISEHNGFEILFQDADLIAINKPPGYLVHRSSIARNATQIVLQELRDQLGQRIYPVHRLDRKTSGVLLFSLHADFVKPLGQLFEKKQIQKEYMAIVRGWTEAEGIIDYELTNDRGKKQDAVTRYQTKRHFEIDLPFGKFMTSRYSEVKLMPETGRMHQLRKHMSHIFHPILGDRPHGCNKQNRLWKYKFDMDTMMLHALRLSFKHPETNQIIEIEAPFFDEYQRVKRILEERSIFWDND
ncbi:MAG: pseudouridine synthase [Bacteroidota bacterium]